jgi:transcription elongation factor Elf1
LAANRARSRADQLFKGTLVDEDKYALEFECPGCGHQGTVRSSDPLRIEWDPIIDGRYIGWAMCASTEIVAEFWMTVDKEFVDAWQGGSMPPESHYRARDRRANKAATPERPQTTPDLR